jgi:hypothetical protein
MRELVFTPLWTHKYGHQTIKGMKLGFFHITTINKEVLHGFFITKVESTTRREKHSPFSEVLKGEDFSMGKQPIKYV